MANTATIKVLVDDAALESLVNKSQQTAKIIRGGFDIATGAAAVFGDKSAAAMEKLANRSIIVANAFNGIEDLIEGLAKQEGFLKVAQKVGIGKEAVEGFAKALPGIGIAATLLIPVLQEVFERSAKNARVTAEEIEKVSGKFTDQKTEVDLLVREYNKSNTSLDRQREIIKDLNKLSPNYFSTSIKNSEELTKQQNKYNKALLTEITLQANKAKISEILGKKQGEIIQLEQEVTRLQNLTDLQAVRNLGFTGTLETAANREELIKQARAKLAKSITETRGKIKVLQNELLKELKPFEDAADKAAEALDKLGGTTEPPPGGGGKGTGAKKVIQKKKEDLEELRSYEAKWEAEKAEELRKLQNEELAKDFQSRRVALERYLTIEGRFTLKQKLDFLEEEFKAGVVTEEEYNKLKKDLYDKDVANYAKAADDREAIDQEEDRKRKERLDKQIATLDAINQLVQAAGNVSNQFFENAIGNIERQTEKQNEELDKAEEAALKRAGDNAIARENIEAQYQKKRTELNTQAEEEIKQIRKKQALADIAVTAATIGLTTAIAVLKSETVLEKALNVALGVAAATAAISAKAQVLKLQQGGILAGPSHSAGGIYMGGGVEAEGGEAVINRRSTMAFGGMLSAINEAGGGAPLLTNTGVGTSSTSQANPIIDYGKLAAAIGAVPTRAYVVTQDISLAQDKQTAIKSKATIA